MLLKDVGDFEYVPPKVDLSNFFRVVEVENGDGSVSTVFNLNEGVVVNGADTLPTSISSPYRVRQGDSLKLLSYKTYGTIDYWWLIAKVNGISDVLESLKPGSVLYLLPKSKMDLIYKYVMEDR